MEPDSAGARGYISTPAVADNTQSSNSLNSSPTAYPHGLWSITNRGAWYGLIAAACALLLFYALLAGLTLAVCGLEMTWLHMRGVTGTPKQRNRALVVMKMKRHSTWMLCSLIMCSVAAGETFPFIIQDLWHGQQLWVPILISTLLVAIFAEILPQYIIPLHAINWGYYCSPLIWGCMILTGVLSYPLALLLDALARNKVENEIFTNAEMAALVKYHEHSERHGGKIGEDANRIMLGALQLNSMKIGGSVPATPERPGEDSVDLEKDIEKADFVVSSGMIMPWSAVRTIDIDELVDMEFIRKLKSWSYSRVPVVGGQSETLNAGLSWEGKHIYGFLHVRNLIGIQINEENSTRCVRDLPLYPLPIIQEDITVYELLRIFQMGMSRMAVVVPNTPPITSTVSPQGPESPSPQSRAPQWTATQRTNSRIIYHMKKAAGNQLDWTTDWAADFLKATQMNIQNQRSLRETVMGFRSPQPIGIVTFEDIIANILRKTLKEERDFFGGDGTSLLTSTCIANSFMNLSFRDATITPSAENLAHVSFVQPTDTSLRNRDSSKRHGMTRRIDSSHNSSALSINKKDLGGLAPLSNLAERTVNDGTLVVAGMDGADERNEESGLRVVIPPRRGSNRGSSSYTESSQGGFHISRRIPWRKSKSDKTEEARIVAPTAGRGPFLSVASLPSRRGLSSLVSEGMGEIWRNVSAAPSLSRPQCTTPLSSEDSTILEQAKMVVKDNEDLIFPIAPVSNTISPFLGTSSHNTKYDQSGMDIDETNSWVREEALQRPRDITGSTVSLSSWNYGDLLATQDGAQRFQCLPIATHSKGLLETVHTPVSNPTTRAGSQVDNIAVGLNTVAFVDENCNEDDEQDSYDGFPSELLGSVNLSRERAVPDYASKTLPRMVGLSAKLGSSDTPGEAENSRNVDVTVYDRQEDDMISGVDGARSTSFWL